MIMNKIQFNSRKEASKFLLEKGIDTSQWTEAKWFSLSKSPAEIHMQALAEAMWDAMNESEPVELIAGQWHLPYSENIDYYRPAVTEDGLDYRIHNDTMDIVKIASARCARTSYNNFDGTSDASKDIKLAEQLNADRHRSPLEHAAKCPTNEEYHSVAKGKIYEERDMLREGDHPYWVENKAFGWFNNFHGWISYRYMVEDNGL